MTINKVAVIGSGVMGSGIAAQVVKRMWLEKRQKNAPVSYWDKPA